jgi:hypothetical protein
MFRLFRYALRQLRDNPGFASTAILTLTIGIGASTAIFAVLDAVLLEPLPFAQPDRLVAVVFQPDNDASVPTMQDYLSRSTTFAGLAAYRQWSPAQKVTGIQGAHRFLIVSQGFFSTLGTRFALGSSWPITGNEQDCSSQAIVSGGYWKRTQRQETEPGWKRLPDRGRAAVGAGHRGLLRIQSTRGLCPDRLRQPREAQ